MFNFLKNVETIHERFFWKYYVLRISSASHEFNLQIDIKKALFAWNVWNQPAKHIHIFNTDNRVEVGSTESRSDVWLPRKHGNPWCHLMFVFARSLTSSLERLPNMNQKLDSNKSSRFFYLVDSVSGVIHTSINLSTKISFPLNLPCLFTICAQWRSYL